MRGAARHPIIFRLGLGLMLGLALLGCARKETTLPASAPALSFNQMGQIVLDVPRIEVVPEYRASRAAPYIEHQMTMPPLEAVRRWTAERLKPTGKGGGIVRVIVKDASIKETTLPRTAGISGVFTRDQAYRYDGRLEVEITAQKPEAQNFSGFSSAIVTRSVSVPEDVSIAERERVWLDLVRQMMDDLNARFEDGIHSNLSAIILR